MDSLTGHGISGLKLLGRQGVSHDMQLIVHKQWSDDIVTYLETFWVATTSFGVAVTVANGECYLRNNSPIAWAGEFDQGQDHKA